MHFSVEIRHPELHKYQVIFGRTPEEAREKARAKLAQWDDQHRRMVKFEKRKLLSWSKQERAEMSKREATALSLDAKFRFEEIENTLINIINKTKLNPVTFMKTVVTFDLIKPPTPSYVNFPIEPDRNDQKYVVTFPSEPNRIDRKYYAHVPLISRLIPYRVRNLTRAMDARYNEDHEFWDEHCANLAKFMDTNFQEDHRLWETQCTEIDVENNQKFDRFTESITEWERQRQNVIGINLARRAEYDNLIENTRALDCDSVEQYFSYVNQNVEWPRELEPTVEFMFEGPTGIISIDCDLPNVDDMPSVKLVKYITSRDSLEEITYKKDTLNILYDNFIYQIILALMWQIINFDDENVVKAISINGWVSYINKANGLDETACIASVYSTKEQFQTLQLDRVEARVITHPLLPQANSRVA